jgi:hypothetical protein
LDCGVPRIKTVKVFPRDRMVTVEDEKRLLAACTTLERCADHHAGLWSEKRGSHQDALGNDQLGGRFYFKPRGKTRKARPPVPWSERVIALLRNIQHEESDRRGWVFPSKKSRAGHIGPTGISVKLE